MTVKKIIQKLNAYHRLIRLDKPIGILLLLWPTLWGLFIAGKGEPDWIISLIFVAGTVLMRSAGCVMNDIADSQYDGLVARTQYRPLVTNEVSKKEAYILAGSLSLIAFSMVCMLNTLSIKLSLVGMLLAISYPFTKRFFPMPQAYLGIAFGWGIPMAFAAILGYVPPVAWLLLLANISWAIAYDTEYAMVDREDDLKIGIQSSAITFGRFDVLAVMCCYIVTLLLLTLTGLLLGLGYAYYMGLALATSVAIHHYFLIRQREKTNCFKAFLANNWFGFSVFMGLAAQYLMSAKI